jgi:hypothetical protein
MILKMAQGSHQERHPRAGAAGALRCRAGDVRLSVIWRNVQGPNGPGYSGIFSDLCVPAWDSSAGGPQAASLLPSGSWEPADA